jgi:putative tryptophan/tyrosine transport system substrate-binding protein
MKKIVGFLIASFMINSSFTWANPENCTKHTAAPLKVLVNKLADHPALDATVAGIFDALKEKGYILKNNLLWRVESAQANPTLAAQISTKFTNQDPAPDFIVGIGTVSSQSCSKQAKQGKVKLIFSSVTDPLGVNLVKDLKKPLNNTSGVSNFVALEPQLQFFKVLQPALKDIGFLYNPGEANSVALVKKLKEICPQMALNLVPQAVMKTADISQSTIKLVKKVQAIFISNDSTALSSLKTIINTANKSKVPVYVSDTDAVALGAYAALGPNQYEIGKQTGNMIARIYEGKDINQEPVEFPKKTELYLNKDAARKLGLIIPEDILKQATKIIGS